MPIVIIYASTSGNVEIVCQTIAKILKKKGFDSVLSRAEATDIELIRTNKHFIFGTSTWEHGRINPFFDKLVLQMKNENFREKKAAFVGLGDKRYEPVLFCHGIEELYRLWLINGGDRIGKTLLIAGEPYGQLDTTVVSWAESILDTWKNEEL